MNLKLRVVKLMRSRKLQPMWERLFHLSKIGMNFWGGASVYQSGEIPALSYISNRLAERPTSLPVVVFDVGANKGQYATLAAQKIVAPAKKVYSFEPSLAAYESLTQVIKEQSLETVVESYNIGFGEEESKMSLYSSGAGATIASVYNLTSPISPFKEMATETVTITTIDGFCREHGIERIDLLKVDIEGHEYHALLGARQMIQAGMIQFIQFEFGDCHIDARVFFRDFYDLLANTYQLYRIVPDGLRAIKQYSNDLEVFSTINYLAELR